MHLLSDLIRKGPKEILSSDDSELKHLEEEIVERPRGGVRTRRLKRREGKNLSADFTKLRREGENFKIEINKIVRSEQSEER